MAFNPELSNWFPVTKFRFWCQKVLPLVYDDSLSYYEVLCKMVDYLNKYGEDLGMLADDYKALVDFVNHYFEQDLSPIIEHYVNEWLDEHPEATTTVQDNSITPAKMNSTFWDLVRIGRDIQFATNIEELRGTTADVVYVTNNDSIFGDNSGCWFWTHTNAYTDEAETIGGITRTDGSVVFAMPNQVDLPASNCPKTDVGRVVASYYQVSNLNYGNENTLYNSVVTRQIDCSAFVSAVLDGISYENSRYVSGSDGTNKYGEYAGDRRVGGTGGDRESLLTWQMAEWFAERKRLFTIPNNKEGWGCLEFGDILFAGSYNTATGDMNERYYGIGHCALVLAVYPNEGKILVAEAGGTPNTIFSTTQRTVKIALVNLKEGIGTHYHVFARPCYGDGANDGVDISGLFSTRGTVTGDGTAQILAEIACSVPMKAGNLYTITVKGDLPIYDETGCWIYAKTQAPSRDANDRYNLFRMYHMSGNGKEINFVGCLDFVSGNVEDVIGMEIYLESSDMIGTQSFRVDSVAITEGVAFGRAGSSPIEFEVDDTTNFTLTRNDSTKANGKIYIEMTISKNTSVTGDKTIGHFTGDVYGTGRYGKTILGRRGNTDVIPFRLTRDGNLQVAATAATGTYYISWEYMPSVW